jgi:hypothetical protein
VAQAFQRVPLPVTGGGRPVRSWVKKEIAGFGDEEEQEAIDEAQELAVVVLAAEIAISQAFSEFAVVPVGEEAGAEFSNGGLNPIAELVEGAGSLTGGFGAPAFQDALFGGLAFEPALMAHQPEDSEVGELASAEHRVEVELDERLASEGAVVAEQPEPQAVGDKPP